MEKIEQMQACNLCPRACQVNRNEGKTGVCGQTSEIRLARAALHFWEEPCISGTSGSGAVFFSGCNLKCIFCQNYRIAHGESGKTISTERMKEIFFELKEQGAVNINLVTPTPFVPQIAKALQRAKEEGLSLPVVYNTSSYERPETLRMLEGLVDIYLPDFKYADAFKAKSYSMAEDYEQVAKAAIAEMVRQVPKVAFDSQSGLMQRGVMVRHLLLPLGVQNAKDVLKYLYQTYGNQIYYSIMNQYTPNSFVKNQEISLSKTSGLLFQSKDLVELLSKYPELARKVTRREYDKVVNYALDIGIKNGFFQEGETVGESFIPEFDNTGV